MSMFFEVAYKKALMDIAEKLNNAEANGYTTHEYTELMDMLFELGSECGVTHDELLAAGKK